MKESSSISKLRTMWRHPQLFVVSAFSVASPGFKLSLGRLQLEGLWSSNTPPMLGQQVSGPILLTVRCELFDYIWPRAYLSRRSRSEIRQPG